MKKIIRIVLAMVLMLLVVGGIIYRMPHSIVEVNANDVSKIAVCNVNVTEPQLIEKILEDLGGSEYKRTKPSGIGGYEEYSIRVYDKSDNLICSIGIANEVTVDTGIFFEQRQNGQLDMSLYQSVVEAG